MKLGLTGIPKGIGDSLLFSSLPENYWRTFWRTNQSTLVDVDQHWIYDNNPFVSRFVTPEKIVSVSDVIHEFDRGQVDPRYLSFAERIHRAFGCDIFVRGPRLYIYEEKKTIPNRVVLHTTGISQTKSHWGGTIPSRVLEHIMSVYKDREVVQIGGISDARIEKTVNSLGLSVWGSVKVIAEADIFIGISSGPIHIANCYPKVRKKIILLNSDVELKYFEPLKTNPLCPGADWIDFGWEYYNCYHFDIGVTQSYLKI